MTSDAEFLNRFSNLHIGKSRDRRAPHKPLLVLWAIGRCLRDESRLVSYVQVDKELTKLIVQFGPHRKEPNTHYPFWRLQNDGIWEVDRANLVRTTKSKDARKFDLKQ